MRIRHGLAAGSHGTSRSTPSRTSCTCLNINLIAVGQVRSGQVSCIARPKSTTMRARGQFADLGLSGH